MTGRQPQQAESHKKTKDPRFEQITTNGLLRHSAARRNPPTALKTPSRGVTRFAWLGRPTLLRSPTTQGW